MENNKTGKTLYTIGVITIIAGVIGSLIMGAVSPAITYDYSYSSGYDIEETYNWSLVIIGAVASFISGICFIGFSEIISLLQKNINKQDEIIKSLKKYSCDTVVNNYPKTALQDIESNLPRIWGVLLWMKDLKCCAN